MRYKPSMLVTFALIFCLFQPLHAETPLEQSTQLARNVFASFQNELLAEHFDVELAITQDLQFDARVYHYGAGLDFYTIFFSDGAIQKLAYDPDRIAAALAHEVGHILGKGPRIEFQNTTAEGEADYFAGQRMVALLQSGILPAHAPHLNSREYREATQYFGSLGQASLRALYARAAAAFLKNMRLFYPGKSISFSQHDNSVVSQTSFDYPSPQGRLDSFVAGLLGQARPRSWALPADFRSP